MLNYDCKCLWYSGTIKSDLCGNFQFFRHNFFNLALFQNYTKNQYLRADDVVAEYHTLCHFFQKGLAIFENLNGWVSLYTDIIFSLSIVCKFGIVGIHQIITAFYKFLCLLKLHIFQEQECCQQ